jgi:hypothetical protein
VQSDMRKGRFITREHHDFTHTTLCGFGRFDPYEVSTHNRNLHWPTYHEWPIAIQRAVRRDDVLETYEREDRGAIHRLVSLDSTRASSLIR